MQELVRLRQHQQKTDALLQALTDYTNGMEERQNKMMSFLSKSIHSPGLLAQLVHHKCSNGHIPGGNKRRLPNQREFEREITSSDGQRIKSQRNLLTEETKSMLMEIVTSDKSPISDSFIKPESISQPGSFNLPIDALNTNRTSSIRCSGMSFLDVPSMPARSETPAVCPSAISEVHPSLDMTGTDKSFLLAAPDEIPRIMADECNADFLSMSYLTSEAESTLFIPSVGVDEMIPVEFLYSDSEIF